jgi:hypothetical protein
MVLEAIRETPGEQTVAKGEVPHVRVVY